MSFIEPLEKWGCNECHWRGVAKDVLIAPNPFEPKQFISGCPDCRQIGYLRMVCDVEHCTRFVCCGIPKHVQ